ncbi:DUF2231 domain-containing protein [Sphingomonas sp. LM7]|uniref:DUF2231 domain-containing protein n=1 Tax=Sphingomonas sp. LM7 TaxID=1938607 RepID=UPI000983B4E3|nr:DUF2231 domain-containing protein [Sphingomonas sp. LM7]AQR73304.1 hypothetical protein BXU08_06275 [Sphingomonas sp. LM7]
MATDNIPRPGVHPLHAILLAFPVALFPSGLAADIAYLKTAEIQWSNFAAWLIAGALLFAAPVLIWAVFSAIRWRRSPVGRRATAYLVALAVMWVLGLLNAFKHSADGWSSVGTAGLILSLLTSICAIAAAYLAYSRRPFPEVRS